MPCQDFCVPFLDNRAVVTTVMQRTGHRVPEGMSRTIKNDDTVGNTSDSDTYVKPKENL